MAKTSGEIAIELRAKFEFYLLALTFGILGLSIQTAGFGRYLSADAFELAGWLALFASGTVGILRAEWIPVAYDIQWKITSNTKHRNEILIDLQRGVERPVTFVEKGGEETVLRGEQAATRFDEIVTELEQQHDATHAKILRRYWWMKVTFMVGIGFLLIARGTPPAMSIAERLTSWLAAQ